MIDVEEYMYGRCHLFALALHEELGYQMLFFMDRERWFENGTGEALNHAMCILPKGKPFKGKYVDASGIITKNYIESEYEWNVPFYEPYTKEKLEYDFKTRFLDKPKKGEIEKLRKYIRKNIEKYQ